MWILQTDVQNSMDGRVEQQRGFKQYKNQTEPSAWHMKETIVIMSRRGIGGIDIHKAS